MKEDFVLKGTTITHSVELEKEVAETLQQMVEFTRYGESEIINVAVKRFIAVHSDFLPRKK
jgi:predicted transcriptional regulator